jgi:hypothetical protein
MAQNSRLQALICNTVVHWNQALELIMWLLQSHLLSETNISFVNWSQSSLAEVNCSPHYQTRYDNLSLSVINKVTNTRTYSNIRQNCTTSCSLQNSAFLCLVGSIHSHFIVKIIGQALICLCTYNNASKLFKFHCLY